MGNKWPKFSNSSFAYASTPLLLAGLSFTSSIFQIQGFCFAWFMLVWPSRSYSTASFCTPAAILYIFCPSYKYIIICDCCTCYSVFPPYWGVLARIINEKALSSFVSLYLEGVTECLRIYSLWLVINTS